MIMFVQKKKEEEEENSLSQLFLLTKQICDELGVKADSFGLEDKDKEMIN